MKKILIAILEDHKCIDKIKVNGSDVDKYNVSSTDILMIVSKEVGEFLEKYSKNG